MRNYARESRPWIIWISIIAVVFTGVGIFFYYTLFRQSKSELIEAIPTDATFIFTLNDNDGFVSGTTQLTPYLNELFVLDALPAYETMRSKLPEGDYDLTISGHADDNGVNVLFNMHADKAAFKRLLRALSIDPKNYTDFENNKIYTYGTNYKSVKFAFLNHIITFSTDIDLLKRSIMQHSHPKNLLSDKQFKEIYELTEKNRKQNWLIINPEKYISFLSSFLNKNLSEKLSGSLESAGWTALQLRFSGNEMYLSGYMLMKDPDNKMGALLSQSGSDTTEITAAYPNRVNWYAHAEKGGLFWKNTLDQWKSVPNDEIVIMKQLSPTEVGCFALRADTSDYHYYLMLPDTSRDFLSVLYANTSKADSVRTACPSGIFPLPRPIPPMLPNLVADSMRWVFANGNAIVLAPSTEAVTAYQKSIKSAGNITRNRYYGFVDEAVASTTLLNWVLVNDGSSNFWIEQYSEKGRATCTAKDLHILSLSCETMNKGKHLLPINLFLHF